jgi:prepilin-type N-terminal cleavage/methylation domain-containing protein
MKTAAPSSGFTLVELTVVLIIVGLLLSGLYLPLSAQQDARQVAAAERQLQEIRDALIGYAQINGRLPCPASSATGTGNEDCGAGDNGFVPWTDLGVSPVDPWGRMVRYRVSTAFRGVPPTFTANTPGALKIQTRQNSALVDLTNDAAPSRSVVFVLVSYGKNGYHGVQRDGVAGPGEPAGLINPDEDTNGSAATTTFVSRTPTPAGTATMGEFDDLVVWAPTTILINRLIAAGKL